MGWIGAFSGCPRVPFLGHGANPSEQLLRAPFYALLLASITPSGSPAQSLSSHTVNTPQTPRLEIAASPSPRETT